MLRKLILVDEETGEEFIFPVTPPGYQLDDELVMQTVEIFGVGDYAMPTYTRRNPIKIEHVLLPVQQYPFCVAYRHADACLAWLIARQAGKKRVRFIVSDTAINVLAYVQDIAGGEYDGTNDWSGSVTLQPAITLVAPQLQINEAKAPLGRAPAAQPAKGSTYIVKAGDTLWGIAKQFYGDGGLCYKLAAYNGIKNANLIKVGQVLKIPDAATLGKTAPVAVTGSTPSAKPQPKQTAFTVTIQATGAGAYRGGMNYSYVDASTQKSIYGAFWSYPQTLTVGSGTNVLLTWKGKDGHSWSRVTVDGVARSAPNGRYNLDVKYNRVISIAWVR